MVEVLAGMAIPSEKIADVLDITKATLRKHYRRELDRGGAMVEAKLVSNLLTIADRKDATALKAIQFVLACRFGWSQYVPRPAPHQTERERPLGKKEMQQIAAETGHERTEWSTLLQ
jgi:hypothetical protein